MNVIYVSPKPFCFLCTILIITPTKIRKAAVPTAMPTINPVLIFDFELRDALTVVSVRVVVVDAVVVVVVPGQ